jgi:hypothetical protein
MRKHLAIALTALIFFSARTRAETPTTDPVGDASMAEHLAQIAQTNLTVRSISDITLRESAALLEAATKLNNGDPRFPRLWAEACLSLHDSDGAIAALKAYTGVDTDDQVAQSQLIDLYSSKMEAADQKVRYLLDKAALTNLSAEVRAHAGTRAAKIMLDRSQDTEAKQALDDALKLNPLDPDALELNEQLSRKDGPQKHIAALFALLRSNPAQPAVAARVAAELAKEGLTAEAATWYNNSISVSNRLSAPTDPGTFLDYLAEVLVGGQTKGFDAAIDSLLDKQPTNAEALYLKLIFTRRGDDKDATTKAMDAARDGFIERVYAAYRAGAGGNDPPATQPAGEFAKRLGDVMDQAKKIKAAGNDAAIADEASALTDLAWLEIYFDQQPDNAAPLIAALHELLPQDDVRFARLEGWSLLNAGKPNDANVKLSAVAERDPLSAMGMIRIASKDPARKDDVKSSAQALLDDNRGGLLAAILMDGLRDQGVAIHVSEAGNAIKADLDKFPKAWFTFLDAPDNFYLISCNPLRVSSAYDEPMLAVVTITNIGPFDISVGPKGAIKPDLWFDVKVSGPQGPQNFPGAAYDRLGQRLVLKKGGVLQQLIRLDQSKLALALSTNPTAAFSLSFMLVTNPVTGASGIAPGPGGQRVAVKKILERKSNPLGEQQQQAMIASLNNTASDVRIRTISMLCAYARVAATATDDKIKASGKQLVDTYSQLGADPSAPVASWARFMTASVIAPDHRAELLGQMVASPYLGQRMLAVVLALTSGPAGKDTLTTLAKDDDPIVKKFAEAALDDYAHPTTEPAAPTSAPSLEPAAPAPAPGSDLRL